MRYRLILLFTIALLSCKSSKNSAAITSPETDNSSKTIGKISHQYRSTGCSTVIVVTNSDGELTLIPKDKLDNKLDKDGIEIYFNYQTLRMPQPANCNVGLPAEITNITFKK